MSEWLATACVLCENNCGIEIKLGDDGRTIEKVRGDESHPASKGYLCQKASRVDHYQNGIDRIKQPLKRQSDGSFQAISWDTAIHEIADKFAAIRDQYGGDKIMYYGGGGQGNHLPGAYGFTTVAALGGRYRSNALAQEKTGEAWVAASMFGAYARTGDFEDCEVAVFIGKNPWQSHGVQRSRVALREIARDPERTLVVFDPRVSETAEIADIHIRVKPGTDAWALAALLAVQVQEGLVHEEWVAAHVNGFEAIEKVFRDVNVGEFCAYCGVPEREIRELARRIGTAESVAWYEDLGTQMNRHSTLVSYLHRLNWLASSSFGKAGSQFIPNSMRPLASGNPSLARRSPVANAPLLGGLVPCNLIADEILSDHPERYRAMLIETANPAHSLADTRKFIEALHALELVVVIDVAMTETAKHADYVLPVATQYEKSEATFFNFEFPHNYFHLRHPVMEPPADADVLIEAEIHARLVEAMEQMPPEVDDLKKLVDECGINAFAEAFAAAAEANPKLRKLEPLVVYRSIAQALPDGCEQAAALWSVAHFVARREGEALNRAGIAGDGVALGNRFFQAILENDRGLIFSVEEHDKSWQRVKTANGKINAVIDELIGEIKQLRSGPEQITSDDYPYVLSAGERRAYTANTVLRGAGWRKKDIEGALRVSPQDASDLAIETGDRVCLRTKSGSTEVVVEVSDRMLPGHVSLPNGFGLDNGIQDNDITRVGTATNELTASGHRDYFAGTPWHKYVPANISAL
ncbi:MAG: molybdopterin-dependent oxidoreductase [Gammaproteobacteria bacterium]